MYFGAQLYGIFANVDMEAKELLKKIKEAGIAFVEPCVCFFDNEAISRTHWSMEKCADLLPYIREIGLDISACFVASQDILSDVPKMIELNEKYGVKAFILGTPGLDEVSIQQGAFAYRSAADRLAPYGIRLLLHNGNVDISAKVCGRTAYEYCADICLGRVGLIFDTGWCAAGGEDPVEFMKRNAHRIEMLHFKDFEHPGEKEPDVCIGFGAVDSMNCLQIARANGIPMLIDQDTYHEFPADLKKSYDRLTWYDQNRPKTVSYLNILDTETGEVKILKKFDNVVEAPNWLKTQNALIFNADDGLVHRYDLETGEVTDINTGSCTMCNNDHVISADETMIAVSNGSIEDGQYCSRIYTIPFATGQAKRITENTPSYLHGWSPDMKELAYCAFRQVDGELHIDVYTIPAEGGEEKRITKEGFNDGPEYSPDGKHIWYISTRSGLMQVWRMNTDGSDDTQMTFEEQNNWFGHVSPDGKKVLNIAYKKGELLPSEHLPNMQVSLWLMDYNGENRKEILNFFGGQGSINVNSWAPDSKRVAFVSYDMQL